MRSNLRKILLPVLGLLLIVSSSLAAATLARAEEKSYYACFSTQNYAVRNANKLERTDGGFVLKNISLSSVIDFYITDNAGSRWYGADDEPVKVDETAVYSYDILFSPEEIFGDTGCHISYRFYEPAEYFLEISGEEVKLEYNPYFTAYELYYISSTRLLAGAEVVYGEEVHEVAENGFYRILFTPEKTTNGSVYAFDENGNYGSGDEFIYSVYIEDAPQYYAVFGERSSAPDAQINGKDAYLLTRYEKTVAAEEYRSPEFFAPERDYGVRYEIYEQTADGAFRLIDDDNNEDTAVSKLTATDCGWYRLSFTDGAVYRTSLEWEDKRFGGWYAVGEFAYGFDSEGNIDLDGDYAFAEVEDGDDDYDEDYKQFILYITVTEKQLRDGDFEFFITDGETKFKDGSEYIKITLAGRYKILCSEEHDYGRGRRFRYVREDESKDGVELNIGTAAEFNDFALKCTQSADYSVNLKVYLTADIDFAGVKFVSAGAFSGVFYGGYHKLKNITSDGCVFETLTHTATVERLTVENAVLGDKDAETVGFVGENYGTVKFVTVSGKITGKNFVGGIAAVNGRSDTETGDSSDLINKAVIEGCAGNAEVYGESFVGGICGRNSGDIISCTAAGKTVGSRTRSGATTSQIGGIAGYSFGKIYGCDNAGAVEGDRYIGGIVGLCVGEVYFCFNRGAVTADEYAGGAVGYYGLRQTDNGIFGNQNGASEPVGSNNILNYILNYGDITANSYAGGVLGNAAALTSGNAPARVLKIYNSASSGNISVEAGSYAGGIAGSAAGTDVVSCVSSGIVQAKGMNGGSYAGGIVGYGGSLSYCASAATVKAAEYIGGIAGYATAGLTGCYTNTLLLPAQDAEFVGEIAGFAANFSAAQDSFTGVAGNYYTGGFGGICGRQYASEYGYAAAHADGEVLASGGTLSPKLCEEFSREYWQGGNGEVLYPLPRNFGEADDCEEFGDDELFARLFSERAEEIEAFAEDIARLTYTVTFMEWNKDNGDLYDDGVLQTDSFDIISAVRVSRGQTAQIPALKYAEANGKGLFVYEGGDARYFVSFPEVEGVTDNATVYAVYREIVTSLADENGTVFAEGEFCKGTQVEVITVGEYRSLEFTLDGEKISVGEITVKYSVGDGAESFTVYGADGGVIESSVSGKYLSFGYSDGSYFTVKENSGTAVPFWGWLLIGIGGTAAVAAVALIIYVIFKKRLQNRNKVL